jgi:hypothetical protein
LDILTKISIVVLVVLILIGCTIFINLATEPVNWRGIAEARQRETEVNAKAARFAQLGEQRALADRAELKTRLEKEKDGLAAQMSGVQKEQDKWQAQATALQRNYETMDASLKALQGNYEQLVKDRKQVEELLRGANQRVLELSKATTDLEAKLQKAGVDYEGVKRLLTVRDEQIRDLQLKIADQERQIAGGAAAKGEVEVTAPAGITGTVDDVKGDIVSLNIGSAQGLKKNMVLVIFRAAQYVGKVRIDEVEVNQSGGIVTDKQLDVAKGDKVTSTSSLK